MKDASHKVGHKTLQALEGYCEAEMDRRQLREAWCRHIGTPGNAGLDDDYLSTDYDWSLRCAVWLAQQKEAA